MNNRDLLNRLRMPKIIDAMRGQTRAPTELELEAAGVIESLDFQLASRIEKAPVHETPTGLMGPA